MCRWPSRARKNKWLVTSASNSAENTYYYTDKDGKKKKAHLCIGAAYDIQIIRAPFACTAQAARVLGTDQAFAAELRATPTDHRVKMESKTPSIERAGPTMLGSAAQ